MLIRIRNNTGLTKVTVPSSESTLADLKARFADTFKVSVADVALAMESCDGVESLISPDECTLHSFGLKNGSILVLVGRIEKEVIAKSSVNDDGQVVAAGTYHKIVKPEQTMELSDSTSEGFPLTLPRSNEKEIQDDDGKSATIAPQRTDPQTSIKTIVNPHIEANAYVDEYVRPPDEVKRMVLVDSIVPPERPIRAAVGPQLQLDESVIQAALAAGVSERDLYLASQREHDAHAALALQQDDEEAASLAGRRRDRDFAPWGRSRDNDNMTAAILLSTGLSHQTRDDPTRPNLAAQGSQRRQLSGRASEEGTPDPFTGFTGTTGTMSAYERLQQKRHAQRDRSRAMADHQTVASAHSRRGHLGGGVDDLLLRRPDREAPPPPNRPAASTHSPLHGISSSTSFGAGSGLGSGSGSEEVRRGGGGVAGRGAEDGDEDEEWLALVRDGLMTEEELRMQRTVARLHARNKASLAQRGARHPPTTTSADPQPPSHLPSSTSLTSRSHRRDIHRSAANSPYLYSSSSSSVPAPAPAPAPAVGLSTSRFGPSRDPPSRPHSGSKPDKTSTTGNGMGISGGSGPSVGWGGDADSDLRSLAVRGVGGEGRGHEVRAGTRSGTVDVGIEGKSARDKQRRAGNSSSPSSSSLSSSSSALGDKSPTASPKAKVPKVGIDGISIGSRPSSGATKATSRERPSSGLSAGVGVGSNTSGGGGGSGRTTPRLTYTSLSLNEAQRRRSGAGVHTAAEEGVKSARVHTPRDVKKGEESRSKSSASSQRAKDQLTHGSSSSSSSYVPSFPRGGDEGGRGGSFSSSQRPSYISATHSSDTNSTSRSTSTSGKSRSGSRSGSADITRHTSTAAPAPAAVPRSAPALPNYEDDDDIQLALGLSLSLAQQSDQQQQQQQQAEAEAEAAEERRQKQEREDEEAARTLQEEEDRQAARLSLGFRYVHDGPPPREPSSSSSRTSHYTSSQPTTSSRARSPLGPSRGSVATSVDDSLMDAALHIAMLESLSIDPSNRGPASFPTPAPPTALAPAPAPTNFQHRTHRGGDAAAGSRTVSIDVAVGDDDKDQGRDSRAGASASARSRAACDSQTPTEAGRGTMINRTTQGQAQGTYGRHARQASHLHTSSSSWSGGGAEVEEVDMWSERRSGRGDERRSGRGLQLPSSAFSDTASTRWGVTGTSSQWGVDPDAMNVDDDDDDALMARAIKESLRTS